jgi:hypothetical protein
MRERRFVMYKHGSHFNLLTLLTLLVFTSIYAGATQAQSTDRDRPTPLKSNELRGELDGSDSEYFYSFVAGPGELTLTFEVTASATNAGATIDLFDKNARSVLSGLMAQGIDRGSERVVKSVRLGARQTLIMRLKAMSYGSSSGNAKGTFLVRLSGAGAQKGETSGSADSQGDDRLGLPTSGILRLEMSDGTTQEINLSRVRRASVKP